MRFSRTRLSEVLHRTALGVAVSHVTVPGNRRRWTHLRGPIQRPLQLSRLVSGGCSLFGTHQRFTPSDAQTKYGAFPPRWLCCPRDHQYYAPFRLPLRSHPLRRSSRLIGLGAPSPPASWHPTGLTAGAETALSCSHDGCANVPRPLRRWVLRGCLSKLFTPSLAFVSPSRTRLPVGSLRSREFRRGRLRFMLRTAGLHLPDSEGSTPRFDAQVSPNVGGLLRRCLGTSFGRTSTGESS